MQMPAWRALPATAQALYPWLKLEWHGPRANNNGKISLSVILLGKLAPQIVRNAARKIEERRTRPVQIICFKPK